MAKGKGSDELYFKVNAGIKNIIGKELIYSDSVAVIELIKNSKDAGASKASIYFQNEQSSDESSSIVLIDDGKGMSLDDIQNKWLNIAYSEKKDNKEGKAYAGNKGVGRFSCDRLGSKLVLYTKSKKGDYIRLKIDWEDFENKNIDDEISQIAIHYEIIDKATLLKDNEQANEFETGTILKIKNIRDPWPTNKLKKLISELEKFSPSLEDTFAVEIYSGNQDKDVKDKLNKRINNNILEKVAFKTTYIKSSIDSKGKDIETSLYYQGQKIYEYKVRNPYSKLKGISTEIHYLDTIARAYFSKHIGIRPIEYGSIFLFYNNFRISPYGNPKNDWLGIDQRKGQGRARYFGTRELFGRIDITDTDYTFEVLSNREGLAQNKAFHELITYDKEDKTIVSKSSDDNDDPESESYGYITNIIRQLETFVVAGLDWNRFVDKLNPDAKKVISDKDLLRDPSRYIMNEISTEHVREACARLLKSNWNINHLMINEPLIKSLSVIAREKHEQFLKDFLEQIESKSFSELSPYEKGSAKRIIEHERERTATAQKERDIAEKKQARAEQDARRKTEEIHEKNRTIEQINSQNTFLKKTSNQDIEDLLVSMHAILVNTSTIRIYLLELLGDERFPKELIDTISTINEANQKNFNIAKFATLYNFGDKQNIINGELTLFIHEYLKEAAKFQPNKKLKISDKLDLSLGANKEFIPLEIMMLLENVISNSNKAKATELVFRNRKMPDGRVLFTFRDNGRGIKEERYRKDPSLIFEKGETSTKGSGIGLYHLKKTVDKLCGKVEIINFNNCFELGVYF